MAKKILIIDDDKDMLEMLNIVFQGSDFDVILRSTGMTAEEVKVVHPDIILLDVQIKGYQLTGDEICKEIKMRGDLNYIPIFLVSAEPDLNRLASDCNANGYFSKPFDILDLKSVIYNLL